MSNYDSLSLLYHRIWGESFLFRSIDDSLFTSQGEDSYIGVTDEDYMGWINLLYNFVFY